MSYLDELEAELSRLGDRPITGADLASALRAVAEIAEHVRDMRKVLERFAVVEELPESAPFAALIRRRGDANLYLGNGQARPLTMLTPTKLNGSPVPMRASS